MSNTPYTRVTERFRVYGIDLNNPVDNVRPGYYPLLENVRSYTDGVLQPRQGLTSINTVVASKTPVHSVRRLNDPINSDWVRIIGTGNALAYGQAAFTQATYNASNVAYDGNPLIMVPYRPDQAVSPFMYIAGQVGTGTSAGSYLRQVKINRAGTVHQMGVPAPTYPPKAELGAFTSFAVRDGSASQSIGYNFQATTNWTTAANRDGTVITADPTAVARIPALAVTTRVLYDSGSTGWCSVVLPATSMSVTGVGSQIDFSVGGGAATSTFIVREVYPGTASAATIRVGAIIYDSDSAPSNTTFATIQPDKAVPEIKRNAIVLINGGTNYYRVISTRTAADGTISFRVIGGGVTISANQSIQVMPSIRVYDTGLGMVPAGGDGVAQNNLSFTCANVSGVGWFQNTTDTADLTVSNKGTGSGRAFSSDDYNHLSVRCQDWSRVIQGRIILNCDAEATATFTKNFYYRTFTPNDLQPAAQGTPTQTAIDNRNNNITRIIADRPFFDTQDIQFRRDITEGIAERIQDRQDRKAKPPASSDPNATNPDDPARTQANTGASQWSELRFKRGEFIRVGSDVSRNWSNINGMRVELTVVAGTGTFTFEVNSLTAWGTYPLDSGAVGTPYIYRTRGRSSVTGARSNYSPPCFAEVLAYRDSIVVTPIVTSSGNSYGRAGRPTEVDYYDIERLGGTLTNWTYVGSVPQGTAFTDIVADDVAAANAALSEGDSNYQPWIVRGTPANGLFSTVAGTMATSTSNFNVDWAKGTAIRVQRSDGSFLDTTIRRIIDQSLGSLVNVEFADSLGYSTANVTWLIAEPLISGTPLPTLWTWNDLGFACGDVNNPGVLYWTNSTNLDGTQDTSFLEVTSPSEPLMNGCSFNGKNYVWSTERLFEIDQIAPGTFIPIVIPGNKGLASIYGLAVGERIWYVSRDGIYQTGGGDSISITDDTLKPLFVREGNAGVAVNGFQPPDFTAPNKIRLSYYDGYLYFLYQNTSAAQRCLTYTVHSEKPGWWPDVFTPAITYIYGEEGAVYTSLKPTSIVHSLLACGADATTAKLYQITGAADGSTAIASQYQTQYFDAQDRRAEKRWGDFVLDADPNNATLNVTTYVNNSTSTGSQLTLSPTTMTGSGRTQQIVDISAGDDPASDYARNLSLYINWSSTSATPKLYLWEPSYSIRPEASDLRSTLWDDAGVEGDKFFQGVEITANTNNIARTVQVEYDGSASNIGDTLTVQHSGKVIKSYAFRPAFTAGNVRLRPTDSANTWKLYDYKWIFQPEPPLGERYESQPTSFGADGFLHMKAAYVMIKSTQNVTLTVTRQEDSNTDTYTIPTSSGLKIRTYVPFKVTKGKSYTFVFSSTSTGGQFRLYKDGTTVLMKPWASEQEFADRSPFGAQTGSGQAPI